MPRPRRSSHAVLLAAGCLLCLGLLAVQIWPGPGQTPRPYTFPVTGCGDARVERTRAPGPVVLDVTAAACPGISEPAGRVARIVWLSSSGDIDAMHVRTAGPTSTSRVLTRAELTRRYGQRQEVERNGDDLLWLVLPLAPMAAAVVAVLIARRAARSGTIVFAVFGR